METGEKHGHINDSATALAIALIRLRPTWTGHLNWTDDEGMRIGFWQPDGANSASSVRGMQFPVWYLLVHFGSSDKRAGRSAQLEECGSSMCTSQLVTISYPRMVCYMHTPLETLFQTLCEQTSSAMSSVCDFGCRTLFPAKLLLACHDVERHPGPPSTFLEKLQLQIIIKKKPASEYTSTELVPYIKELLTNA